MNNPVSHVIDMFKNGSVLVTGGTGFVGVNLVKRLLSLGANIRATIHKKSPVIVDDRIDYVKCDLIRKNNCKKVMEGTDYVFHCAAITSGAAAMQKNPLIYVTPNLLMNSQLLEAAYFARVKKFLYLSSTTIYPDMGNKLLKEEDGFANEPFPKYFCVGWMNRYTEVLCRMYSEILEKPIPTIVLRPTNIYGEYDDFEPETSHVLPALIRKVVERQNPLEVWGTGENVRDLIYIDDLIDAMILAMEKMHSYNPINIGLGKGYSVREMLQVILEVDGYTEAQVVFDSSKPSVIPIRLIDTSKAEKKLGFKAKVDLREGITRTINWYKKGKFN